MQLHRLLILLASVMLQKCATGINLSDYLRQALPTSSSVDLTYTKTVAEILGSEPFDPSTQRNEEYREDVSPETLLNGTSSEISDHHSTEIDDEASATNSTNDAPDDDTSAAANESQSLDPSSHLTSLATGTSTRSTAVVNANSTSDGQRRNESSIENEDEDEGVVRGKPTTAAAVNVTMTSKSDSVYAEAFAFISDKYTLSILVPVAAGVVFASSVLLTLALCRCLRWKCRRRRLRKKALPGSVKHLNRSDSARLLAESSDEEF